MFSVDMSVVCHMLSLTCADCGLNIIMFYFGIHVVYQNCQRMQLVPYYIFTGILVFTIIMFQ